jgi:hypothetical protein
MSDRISRNVRQTYRPRVLGQTSTEPLLVLAVFSIVYLAIAEVGMSFEIVGIFLLVIVRLVPRTLNLGHHRSANPTQSELEDPDDDGTPIEAWLRTGLTDQGEPNKKRYPTAHWAYTADGTLLFITRSVHEGKHIERWYRREQAQAVPSERSLKMRKGITAVRWQFELRDVDGSDFDWRDPDAAAGAAGS